MKYYAVAFALWFLTLFWGAGLAWMLSPRRWKKFWPVWAPFAGWALQSAVVWQGTRLGLPGTDSYAFYSLGIPGLLLAISVWKRGKQWFSDIARFWPLWLVSLGCLAILTWPMAASSHGLTTISLGSCDAADYAAGARVLKEFAQTDRSGFLGLSEVVQLHSVDNFYDHWLRLNHFTPSALVALQCTLLNCEPFHLISLFTASLLALSLPLVYWLGRSLLRYGHKVSLGITVLYALCPITWYAVFHVAPGQMLAAQAIAAVTWAGIKLWRNRNDTPTDLLGSFLLLLVAYWVILGSYNFIIIVCLVPALAYVGIEVLLQQKWRHLLPWSVAMILPLGAAVLLFAERARGLAERFLLFRQFDFGWQIPALSPEGWFGMVGNVHLMPIPQDYRWVLLGIVLIIFTLGAAREMRSESERSIIAFCLAVPGLAGYCILIVRGILLGTNASYDAYKLLSVFYPGLLLSICLGVVLLYNRGWLRWCALTAAGLVLACNISIDVQYIKRMSNPPLKVDPPLADLRQVDRLSNVPSVNMLIPDFWDRLWANAFLLKKKQYFQTYTYEGRRNTPLRGQWDLVGGLARIISPNPSEYNLINGFFSLHDTRSIYHARCSIGEGWYERERYRNTRWRWSKGDAVITIDNPQRRELRATARIDVLTQVDRDLQIWIGNREVARLQLKKGRDLYAITFFTIPVGPSRFELRSSVPPASASPTDGRQVGICLYGLDIQVQK